MKFSANKDGVEQPDGFFRVVTKNNTNKNILEFPYKVQFFK